MASYQDFIKEVLSRVKSTGQGLSSQEAKNRLKEYGPNILKEEKRKSPILLFLEQFISPVVWILIGAMVLSYLFHETTDTIVIGAIVVLNALLGFVQEYKAEGAIEALKKLIALKTIVIRDGKEREISAEELVPGDVILLQTGDKAPADAQLLESANLQTQEAALTGESTPVRKDLVVYTEKTPIAERKSLLYAGTIIVSGHAKAVVVQTGMKTEMGKIAKLIQEAKPEPTLLQKELGTLSIFLGGLVVAIAGIVFLLGYIQGRETTEMIMASIALAVAAIPEGLPAVVTIALSVGVVRMARTNALIRKLPSVETLGACSVICSDKTGTLTHNEMTVVRLYANRQEIGVSGAGYEPTGMFTKNPENCKQLLVCGVLNNDSNLVKNETWQSIGDPTETALLVAAKKAGIDPLKLRTEYPRTGEIEFTSERKRMTTIHKVGAKKIAYVKGAPEIILARCTKILIDNRVYKLTREEKNRIFEKNEEFAEKALRVLGFAYKEITNEKKAEEVESELTFLGLQAMIDPPRKEVRDAIALCESAGIKVVMITGDHLKTAQAIAKDLAIPGRAITGPEIETIPDFAKEVEEIGVYARVDPEHKMKIVEALKKNRHVVAMTGDGVNDAPALKKADIGIAMGISGTEVAKEASTMILADDNFTSIVNAVREGRVIFDNIKKFVVYLLSCNLGEVLTVFMAMLIKMPLPLTALQILWMNLVTDGLPALALGVEPPEPGVMKRQPRNIKEKIVSPGRALNMTLVGGFMTLVTLFVFDYYQPEIDLAYAQTVAFSTLIFAQIMNSIAQRSEHDSIFKLGFTNRWIWGAILSTVILQLILLYTPLSTVFGAVPLDSFDLLIVFGAGISVLVFAELLKVVRRII